MNQYLVILAFNLCIAIPSLAQEHSSIFLKHGEPFHTEEFDGKKVASSVLFRSGSTASQAGGVLVVVNNSATENARSVLHFNQVPDSLICHMRVKFEGNTYNPKNPWLDIGGGHRNHFRFFSESVAFSSEEKELTKRKIDYRRPGNMLPLNEWLHITIELRKGKIGLSINGKTQIYQDDQIEMGKFPKIAIKAIPKGKLHVDYIRVWEAGDS